MFITLDFRVVHGSDNFYQLSTDKHFLKNYVAACENTLELSDECNPNSALSSRNLCSEENRKCSFR